ncbi:MAG TPA: hypothetical protein VF469_40775 [Kofleriaceae bacterium]
MKSLPMVRNAFTWPHNRAKTYESSPIRMANASNPDWMPQKLEAGITSQ